MGTNSLRKLQTRYQYADLEKNEFIPDVIKEKLGKSFFVCCRLLFFMTYAASNLSKSRSQSDKTMQTVFSCQANEVLYQSEQQWILRCL